MSVDITKFCSVDDIRSYLNAPMKSTHGAIACNGHILVCAQQDGEFADAIGTLNETVCKWHGIEVKDGTHMDDVALPPIEECGRCGGTGTLYQDACDECDGDGEFDHGRNTYECKECDGSGFTDSHSNDKTSAKPCSKCQGRGEEWKYHKVGDAGFSLPYLRMLKDLPNCLLQKSGPESMAKFTFDGGWGALMPMRE